MKLFLSYLKYIYEVTKMLEHLLKWWQIEQHVTPKKHELV